MRSAWLVPALACGLAGCNATGATPPTAAIATTSPFDAKEAAFIKTQGKAKISGHAFWRTGEGNTIDAAGETIRLVPATTYARDRFTALYRGGRSIDVGAISQAPSDPAYADYTRTTRAESNGRFEFDKVAPGTYFVTAQITWKDKHQSLRFQSGMYSNVQHIGQEGGAMYDTVTVPPKEDGTVKLVLTNDR